MYNDDNGQSGDSKHDSSDLSQEIFLLSTVDSTLGYLPNQIQDITDFMLNFFLQMSSYKVKLLNSIILFKVSAQLFQNFRLNFPTHQDTTTYNSSPHLPNMTCSCICPYPRSRQKIVDLIILFLLITPPLL